MGRISAGVRGLLVSDDEQVVGMAIVNTDGDEIVIVTDKGYGKLSFQQRYKALRMTLMHYLTAKR